MFRHASAPRRRAFRYAGTAVLAAALTTPAGALAGSMHAVAATPAASAAAASVTTGHPFSDPVYYPLRDSVEMGCANGNPGTKNTGEAACRAVSGGVLKHGYPAIDWLSVPADAHPAVFAAGAGIFHIGSNSAGQCGTGSAGGEGEGIWVWVDHGGGLVSRYHHLDKIATGLNDGDAVTPTTKLGTMGRTGSDCNGSQVDYLHFEVRTGGVHGKRTSIGVGTKDSGIGSLYACENGHTQTWPREANEAPYLGKDNWNKVEWHVQPFLPSADSSCIPPSFATPDKPANFKAIPGDGKITLQWDAAAAGDNVDGITIGEKIFRPSQNNFSQESWRTGFSPTSSGVTFTQSKGGDDIVNGRAYRYRVLFHSNAGNSAWTKWIEVVPGAVPDQSPGVRTANVGRTQIGWGWLWTHVQDNGSDLKRFDLAIRKYSGGSWGAWDTIHYSPDKHYYPFENLKPHTKYAVRVRGVNGVGAGPWLTRSYTTQR